MTAATEPAWLPDSELERIEATIPRCPTEGCGSPIRFVHFVAHQVHSFQTEIDGVYGDILASAQHYDTTFVEPEQDWKTVEGKRVPAGVTVECENGHSWAEARLKWNEKRSSSLTVSHWEITP